VHINTRARRYESASEGDAAVVLDRRSKDQIKDQAPGFNWGAIARILIAALIVPELIYFSRPIDIVIVDGSKGWWLFLVQHHRTFAAVFSTSAIAAVIFSFSGGSIRESIGQAVRGPVEAPATRAVFLGLHLAAVAGLIAWVFAIVLTKRLDTAEGPAWFFVGAGLSGFALFTWFGALTPAAPLLRWARMNRGAMAAAIAVAVCARIASVYSVNLWNPLSASTLWGVDAILRMLGQTTIVDPGAGRIGTGHFRVTIWAGCSGVEGIGLMSVFVAGYLWFCRRELRFPAALILLPIGVVSIWVLNVVRIAALILIGGWSPRVAIDGFHTVAGWLFYTVAACGIVVVSRRSPIFSRTEPDRLRLAAENPAAMYLAPMLTLLLIAMLTRIAGGGFDYLYPLKVAGVGAVIWFYRARLAEFRRSFSWFPILIGAVVFIEWVFIGWILLQRGSNGGAQDVAFAAQLGGMSAPIAFGWLAIRVIGAAVTVPIAEELAFRGYLLRKLVNSNFARVEFNSFTMVSFVVSSVLFGMLHQQWLAGVIAGMLFAIAMYRRGAILDAIIAHSTANAMLAAYVLATHHWWLWN
jgi:exosortase E/protease (VPEID-CTERM system)